MPDEDGDEPDGTDECICPADTSRGYITDDELFALFSARRRGVRTVMISGLVSFRHHHPVCADRHATDDAGAVGPAADGAISSAGRLPPEQSAGSRSAHAGRRNRLGPLDGCGADVDRLPGHGVQLRRVLSRPSERSVHLRGARRFEVAAEDGHLQDSGTRRFAGSYHPNNIRRVRTCTDPER